MDYVMEAIPAEEMYRFDSLSYLRRESIKGAKKWVVSKDKRRFYIRLGKMDHIPFNVRVDEKMPDPLGYYFFGYENILYGIETKQKEVLKGDDFITAVYEPTIVYAPNSVQDCTEFLLLNARNLMDACSEILHEKRKTDPDFPSETRRIKKDIVFNEVSFKFLDAKSMNTLL